MTAERLMMIAGVVAFITIIYWVRKRELREKYAMVWTGVSLLILALGLFPQILIGFAEWAKLSYATATLFVILGPLVLFAFSTSVSLSRSFRKTTRHTQELALLEKRVRELEERLESQSIDTSDGIKQEINNTEGESESRT